jgi:hypothetical protein
VLLEAPRNGRHHPDATRALPGYVLSQLGTCRQIRDGVRKGVEALGWPRAWVQAGGWAGEQTAGRGLCDNSAPGAVHGNIRDAGGSWFLGGRRHHCRWSPEMGAVEETTTITGSCLCLSSTENGGRRPIMLERRPGIICLELSSIHPELASRDRIQGPGASYRA